jgi:hypothetical protein
MEDNQIYFNIKDNKVKISYKHKALTIADFIQVVSTGILMAMKGIVDSAPDQMKQQVTEDLYDMYNAAASNTLQYFAPEIEMRPHLTTQAILKAEDTLIEQEYQKVKKNPKYVSPITEK